MAGTMVRASADDLMHVGLDQVLFMRYAEKTPIFRQILDVRPSSRKYEKGTTFSVLGLLGEKPEGQAMATDDPYQGYDSTFTHKTQGLEVKITHELQRDDLYDVIARIPSCLADSVTRTQETHCANTLFNNGFTVASPWTSGGDGQYLFSTAHPLAGGGTYGNKLSTDQDLAVSSLEEALRVMRLTVGDRNELLGIEPRILLVPPHLERVAFELTKSPGRPDTANRADNWLATQGLTTVVWSYLTDTDAWFILSDKAQHNLVYYDREALNSDSDRDIHSRDFIYNVICAYSIGWYDWRGVVATPGA